MPNREDILWFKNSFGAQITTALAATPFTLDMLTALACQETGEVWPILRRKGLPTDEILGLCVGDTLDRIRTFPKNRADLVAKPRGQAMFELARNSLVDMAKHVRSYRGAASNPDKFCKGLGLFQYDLQFFRTEPDYFLDKTWATLEGTLGHALIELKGALRKLGLQGRATLSDLEFAYAGIVYNTGTFNPRKGLKQGYEVDGKYYGELIFEFVRLARSVPWSPTMTRVARSSALEVAAAERAEVAPGYYPHWAWRDGSINRGILARLPAGTIVGVHHMDEAVAKEVLAFPGKTFSIAWYAESNPEERDDKAHGIFPKIADRIRAAASLDKKLRSLERAGRPLFDRSQFSGLIELDAARERPKTARQADAEVVKEVGFKYLGKSPKPSQVDELRQWCGEEFVPRIVFEDATITMRDPEYLNDAIALSKRAKPEILTLVIHERAYDGGSATPYLQAIETLRRHFADAQGYVEAIHGKPCGDQTAFELLMTFKDGIVDRSTRTMALREHEALLPAGRSSTATGRLMRTVDRGEAIPLFDRASGRDAKVAAFLPAGQSVILTRALDRAGGSSRAKRVPVATMLGGTHFEGFADLAALERPAPSSGRESPASSAVGEAHLKPASGTIVKRSSRANAYSLNEPQAPTRQGGSMGDLVRSLGKIVDWLDVEKATHLRYKPTSSSTFCNIYAHDYCTLAGVYLPRVWWTGPALIKLARGETVVPKYELTVDEVRANDLFRWLRDFGVQFGWRRAISASELQTEVNGGAVGVIVARRKIEGRSGHIVMVVPESSTKSAVRNSNGDVTKPLQSQAGATNFKSGTSTLNWWLGEQFAESAFWLHA